MEAQRRLVVGQADGHEGAARAQERDAALPRRARPHGVHHEVGTEAVAPTAQIAPGFFGGREHRVSAERRRQCAPGIVALDHRDVLDLLVQQRGLKAHEADRPRAHDHEV